MYIWIISFTTNAMIWSFSISNNNNTLTAYHQKMTLERVNMTILLLKYRVFHSDRSLKFKYIQGYINQLMWKWSDHYEIVFPVEILNPESLKNF